MHTWGQRAVPVLIRGDLIVRGAMPSATAPQGATLAASYSSTFSHDHEVTSYRATFSALPLGGECYSFGE